MLIIYAVIKLIFSSDNNHNVIVATIGTFGKIEYLRIKVIISASNNVWLPTTSRNAVINAKPTIS